MRATLVILVLWISSDSATATGARFDQRNGELGISIADVEVATYVYQHTTVTRPFFAPLRTLSGTQVTRNQPPRPGDDAVDHPEMHPGLWLSFGDLNGHDYWRLKAPTTHVRFVEEPSVGSEVATFAVLNQYRTADRARIVCDETCRYSIRLIPKGYLLTIESVFAPVESTIVFGDQEEMGLGARVASALAVDRRQGGRILDSEERRDGAGVWGKTADWVDYSGPLNGKWAGITLMSDPQNFGRSWSHARDYGLVVLNPFGRNAFTKESPARLEVAHGKTLTLRFAVVVHETKSESDYLPAMAFQTFTAP